MRHFRKDHPEILAPKPVSLAGLFMSFNMNDTSCHFPCQDVLFMNNTSTMIEEENHQQQEKSPLRLLREQAGLTRPQVKQRIGISERRQADWESGKALPSAENIAALCRMYSVSLKTMFQALGVNVSGIPDDLSDRPTTNNQHLTPNAQHQ